MNSCRKYNRRRRPYIYLLVAVVAYVIFRRLVRQPEATGSPSVESRFLEKVFAVVNRFMTVAQTANMVRCVEPDLVS